MKKMLISTSLAALLLAGGTAYAAQDAGAAAGHRGGMMAKIDTNGDGNITRAEAIAAADARFARMDVNKDGRITKEDRQARAQQHLDKRFAKLDADGNGAVTKQEMQAAHDQRAQKWAERRAKHQAAAGQDGKGRMHHRRGHGHWGHHGMKGGMGMDANKDGTITQAEARDAATRMFDRLDTNKDGTITKAERDAVHAQMKAKWEQRRAQKQAQ